MSLSRAWPVCSLLVLAIPQLPELLARLPVSSIILRKNLSGRVPSIRTCRSTVDVRNGQDNNSMELIEVSCPCAHTRRSLLASVTLGVTFHVLYEVVRETGWVQDDVTSSVGSGVCHSSTTAGCLNGAFCVTLAGKEPASMGTGNGEESSTKKGSWSTDGIRIRSFDQIN